MRSPDTRPVRFKQILIVDQDEAWALVMRDAVARGGYCVVLPASLEEAIRILRDQAPDLVLISCLLDGKAAETLLGEIDPLKVVPPVVLVGLRDADAHWVPWKSRHFVSIVRQPFKTQDVLDVVKTLLVSPWDEGHRNP